MKGPETVFFKQQSATSKIVFVPFMLTNAIDEPGQNASRESAAPRELTTKRLCLKQSDESRIVWYRQQKRDKFENYFRVRNI